MAQVEEFQNSVGAAGNGHELRVLIAVGANCRSDLGDPGETILAALNMVSACGIAISATSPLYRSPAFPSGNGPDYVNGAVAASCGRSAAEILNILADVELECGRIRGQRWAPRTLDLDLIAVGDIVLPNVRVQTKWRELDLDAQKTNVPDQLILPHPRVQDRAFVLVPLADVAPDWKHPILGKTVLEMLDNLPKDLCAEIQPI